MAKPAQRDKYIQVTATEHEKHKIDEAARNAGLSTAAYLRMLALSAATEAANNKPDEG